MPYRSVAVAGFYIALTAALAWPLSVRPHASVLWSGPDTELLLWILSWDVHAFTAQPLAIFDANIFYPLHYTLAFAENLIGSALMAAPFLWITGNPVLAMNAVVLLNVVLCGLGAHLLARRAGIGVAGAFVAGVIFAASPPRFFRLGQLHLGAVQWIPFALAFLHAYLDGGRRRDLLIALAFFSLQALASGHAAVFLGVAMAVMVAWRLATGMPLAPVRRLRDFGVAGALVLVPAVLVTIPYLTVQDDVALRRALAPTANVESFIASPAILQSYLLSAFGAAHVNEIAEAYLFPGYLPLLLAAAGALTLVGPRRSVRTTPGVWWSRIAIAVEIAMLLTLGIAIYVTMVGRIRLSAAGVLLLSVRDVWRPWVLCAALAVVRFVIARRAPLDLRGRVARARDACGRWRASQRSNPAGVYAALTAFTILISIGPPFGIWPLLYRLPGFNFVRVPSRFSVLAILGLAMLAAVGVERLRARLSPRGGRVLAVAITGALILEFAAVPLAVTPYRVEIPAADRWLALQPQPFAIAEMPAPGVRGALPKPRLNTLYMLHSTAHWQKTVHGLSGTEPPQYTELYRLLESFPSDESLQALDRFGVRFVVVHQDLYPAELWPAVEAGIRARPDRLRLEFQAGTGRVYSLRRF